MKKLDFLDSEVLQSIVQHTAKHGKCHQPYSDIRAPLGFWLVKDSGCYLMSASKVPQDRLNRKAKTDKVVVCYADGFDPYEKDFDYSALREFLGGDDFVTFLPFPKDWKATITNLVSITVEVLPNGFRAVWNFLETNITTRTE